MFQRIVTAMAALGLSAALLSSASAATHTVGVGKDFQTIQDGIFGSAALGSALGCAAAAPVMATTAITTREIVFIGCSCGKSAHYTQTQTRDTAPHAASVAAEDRP